MLYKKLLKTLFLCAFSVSLNGCSVIGEAKESGKIVAGAIGAASLHGILNDQVTIRVCREYFTKGFHKDMIESNPGWVRELFYKVEPSDTALAATWGVFASWWVGGLLGIPATLAARLGSWPKLGARELVVPMGVTMGLTGLASLIKGMLRYNFLQTRNERILDLLELQAPARLGLKNAVSESEIRKFGVNLTVHYAAYEYGVKFGIGLLGFILVKRFYLSR